MSFDLVREHVDGAGDEARRAVRMRACTAAEDSRRETAESFDVERLERVGQCGETEDAGTALPGALAGEIASDA